MFFRSIASAVSSFVSNFSTYISGAQSIPATTWTKVEFDTERWDNNSEFDKDVNFRFTAKATGYYRFGVMLSWASWEAGKILKTAFRLNGGTEGIDVRFLNNYNGVSSQVCKELHLTVDDYVEVFVWHDNAAAKSINADSYATFFDGHRYK